MPIQPDGLHHATCVTCSKCVYIEAAELYVADQLASSDEWVCRGAAAAVVVFDITNAESFAKAKNWVKELQRQGNPNMIMALAGNKADLAAQRAVTTEDAKVCPWFLLHASSN